MFGAPPRNARRPVPQTGAMPEAESTRKPLGYLRREFQANTRSRMAFRISSRIPEIHRTAGEFAFEYQTKKRSKAPQRAARPPAKKASGREKKRPSDRERKRASGRERKRAEKRRDVRRVEERAERAEKRRDARVEGGGRRQPRRACRT